MHLFLSLHKKKEFFECSNSLPSEDSEEPDCMTTEPTATQTGFPTARFQDNSVAFHCYSYEETIALDFIHRNYIQTKPQWFLIFSACNYTKVSISH